MRPAFDEGGDDVLVHRLADSAWLLGAVQHGEVLDRRRQGIEERGHVKRAVQPNLQNADLFASADERIDTLLDSADA